MAGNFEFLRNKFPDLAENGAKAESYLDSDNKACMSYISTIFDSALKRICKFNGIDISTEDKYAEWIVELRNRGIIDHNMNNTLHDLRTARNAHSHNDDNSFTAYHRKTLLLQCLTVCKWLNNNYGSSKQRKTSKPKSNVAPLPQKTLEKSQVRDVWHEIDPTVVFLRACKSGTVREIKDALNRGVNVNVINHLNFGNRTGLMLAVAYGKVENVKFLIKAGADINARDDDNRTVLTRAAVIVPNEIQARVAIIEILLKAGADVNEKDSYNRTILMQVFNSSSFYDHPCLLQIIEALVKAGCDVNTKDYAGKTVFNYVTEANIHQYTKDLIIKILNRHEKYAKEREKIKERKKRQQEYLTFIEQYSRLSIVFPIILAVIFGVIILIIK